MAMANGEDEAREETAEEAAEEILEELMEEEQEHSILQALHQKGPAMPAELAVRTYSFPEEISEPLGNLEKKGLVERQPLKSGEMIVLTKEGLNQIKHSD
jgi:DNA-binding MarR family transcriptional regulator